LVHYYWGMSTRSPRSRGTRIVLIVTLAIAVVVLGVAVAVLVPILTHSSAGASGQKVPTDYVSESSATGEDGRERTLRAERADGTAADLSEIRPGDALVVRGSGFDSRIGIYVSVCAIPEDATQPPGPCLGGIPEGAETGDADREGLTSAWVSSDWAWRAFATDRYDDTEAGTFAVELTVPEPVSDGLDCTQTRCAVATRADHTARSDRGQDMLLPVRFAP